METEQPTPQKTEPTQAQQTKWKLSEIVLFSLFALAIAGLMVYWFNWAYQGG